MNAVNERAEQRKHRRFEVPTGSLVSFGFHCTVLGKITDISVGGLAFRYIGEAHPNRSFLDISLTEHNFHLSSVRFRAVADFVVDNQVVHTIPNGNLLPGRTLRRCGVKFQKLTRHQKAEIERFIQNYTMGKSSTQELNLCSIVKE